MEDTLKIGKNVIGINTLGVIVAMFAQTIVTTIVIVTSIDKYEARLTAAELRIKDIETGKLKIGINNNNNFPLNSSPTKPYTAILFYENKKILCVIPPRSNNTTL
jgi:hypothetical protein